MSPLPVQAGKHDRHFSPKVFAHGLDPVIGLHPLEHVLNEMGSGSAIAAGETIGRENEQNRLAVLSGERRGMSLRMAQARAAALLVPRRRFVTVLSGHGPPPPCSMLPAPLKLCRNR